ncbi:MAG: amidohydrolase family protein [Oscillospiraceae bacterium]|nr:amidohydrolase family protein [Oscillospiraceae bacterium]
MIFECHGHIMLDGVSYNEAVMRHQNGVDEVFVRKNLQINADHGITFFRDGGDKYGATVFARQVAAEYGIDYRTPTFLIHKKGYYGSMFGRAYEDLAGYRRLVGEAKALGADFIKLAASGMIDFEKKGRITGHAMPDDELREIINIAHGEGFSTMVHVNGAENIRRAAEAGADSIEHGFFMDLDALEVIKQTGAVWVPTGVAAGNLLGKEMFDGILISRIIKEQRAMLKTAAKMGIPIACGSDVGAAYVLPGEGTLNELAVLESLSIDPEPGNKKIEEVFKRKC